MRPEKRLHSSKSFTDKRNCCQASLSRNWGLQPHTLFSFDEYRVKLLNLEHPPSVSAQDGSSEAKPIKLARDQTLGCISAKPIPPHSSPGVVPWLAWRTGRQTSGAARWAAGRRAIAGGDGATRNTDGDGAPRTIGRRIGMAGAAMHGRGRCRDGGAENDCGGQRDCRPARHFGISGLSCRGLAPNRLATAALSCLGKTWGWGRMTPSASGWVVRHETHQIPASERIRIERQRNPGLCREASPGFRFTQSGLRASLKPLSPRQNPSVPCASYPARTR